MKLIKVNLIEAIGVAGIYTLAWRVPCKLRIL